jgi:hypothetical protein
VVFVYFNRPQLLPTGHMAALELSCGRRRELEPWEHVTVLELSCARRRKPRPRGTWRSRSYRGPWWQELEPQGTCWSRSCPVLGDGSRGHGARDGLGAAAGLGGRRWSHEARDGSELPCARRREPWDTRACAPVLSFVLTWSLYTGASSLQGTNMNQIHRLACRAYTSITSKC